MPTPDLALFYGDAPPFILFAVLIGILTLATGIMPSVFSFYSRKVNEFLESWVDPNDRRKAKDELSKLLEPQSAKLQRNFGRMLTWVTLCLLFLFARIGCYRFAAELHDQHPIWLWACYSIIGFDVLVYFGLALTILYLIRLYKFFVAATSSLKRP